MRKLIAVFHIAADDRKKQEAALSNSSTVFSGSGFLDRHVVRALANRGYRVRVAVRRLKLAGFLQPMGRVGQVSRRAVQTCATRIR